MKVEFNDDRWPKGTEFHITGLGTVVNGKTTEFSAEEVASFEAYTGESANKALKGNENLKVSGSGASTSKGGED